MKNLMISSDYSKLKDALDFSVNESEIKEWETDYFGNKIAPVYSEGNKVFAYGTYWENKGSNELEFFPTSMPVTEELMIFEYHRKYTQNDTKYFYVVWKGKLIYSHTNKLGNHHRTQRVKLINFDKLRQFIEECSFSSLEIAKNLIKAKAADLVTFQN